MPVSLLNKSSVPILTLRTNNVQYVAVSWPTVKQRKPTEIFATSTRAVARAFYKCLNFTHKWNLDTFLGKVIMSHFDSRLEYCLCAEKNYYQIISV